MNELPKEVIELIEKKVLEYILYTNEVNIEDDIDSAIRNTLRLGMKLALTLTTC